MIYKKLLSALLIPVAFYASALHAEETWKPGQAYSITILHMNDHHGSFDADSRGQGGLAAEKSVVDQIRAEIAEKGGDLLLLSAGDINTGVPESDMLRAKPDLKGMELMKFNAMTIGNHEFDHGYAQLKEQEQWVSFPFLSANIYDKQTKQRAFKPYTIITFKGVKVAIVGLTTPDTANATPIEVSQQLLFNNPITESKKVLSELMQNEKPDIKIALTHLGYYENANYGSNAPGDVSLARALDQGAYHLIIGGHSHTAVCMDESNRLVSKYLPTQPCKPDFQNGIYIMQAFEKSKYLGRADFTFQDGKLRLDHYQLIPINLKHKVMVGEKQEYQLYGDAITPDPDMSTLLTPFAEEGSKLISFKVGETRTLLQGESSIVRQMQTNLGRMIADAYQSKTDADLAVMNSGGVRTSIQEGEITYRDILKVLPFANQVAYATVTGDELIAYLTDLALKTKGAGGYVQFSSNVGLDINMTENKVSHISIDGKAIQSEKNYRIALPNFSAAGGDKYPVLSNHPNYVDTGFIDADVLKEYIKSMESVTFKTAQPIRYMDEMRSTQ